MTDASFQIDGGTSTFFILSMATTAATFAGFRNLQAVITRAQSQDPNRWILSAATDPRRIELRFGLHRTGQHQVGVWSSAPGTRQLKLDCLIWGSYESGYRVGTDDTDVPPPISFREALTDLRVALDRARSSRPL